MLLAFPADAVADYPGFEPTTEYEYFEWGSGETRECFIALQGWGIGGLWWFPVDCGNSPFGPEVDAESAVAAKIAGALALFNITSRIESYRFTGRVKGGADTFFKVNGSFYSMPPGYLANAASLYKWNGSQWVQVGNTGYHYNLVTSHRYAPPFNFGYPGSNARYYLTGYSYVLTFGGWTGTNGASTGNVFMPFSGLAPSEPSAPPPPPINTEPIPPPPSPTPFGK